MKILYAFWDWIASAPYTIVGIFLMVLVVCWFLRILLKKPLDSDKVNAASAMAMVFLTVAILLQTFIQADATRRQAQIQRTADWSRFHLSCHEIVGYITCPKVGETVKMLPHEEKMHRLQEIQRLLISQLDNPVLLENRMCLGHWRNMQSIVSMWLDAYRDGTVEIFENEIKGGWWEGIMTDWGYVWSELVLDSGHVSATGGRPEDK